MHHKIGATLDLVGQLTLDGQVQDMTGWTAAAHMRGPGGTYVLNAGFADAAAGAVQLTATPAQQIGWTPGRYAIDVRLESPAGQVLISSTAQIELSAPVTTLAGGTP